MSTTTLTIRGMSCGSCRSHIDAALRAVPGVTQTRIDLADGTASVTHADGTTAAELIRAVEEAGYEARL